MSRRLAVLALPAVLAVVALLPSLWAGFVTDDFANSERHVGFGRADVVQDLRRGPSTGPHYRPIEPISFRVDNAVWKRVAAALGGRGIGPGIAARGESVDGFWWKHAPWGYHVSSILLHAASTAVLTWIALQVTGSMGVALLAGALFALHPAAAAAAGWVSGRANLFVTLFLLCALASFLRFRDSGLRRWIPPLLVAYALALLSKEQAYFFPVVLLAWMRPADGDPPLRGERHLAWIMAGLVVMVAVTALALGYQVAAGALALLGLLLAVGWAIATSRSLALAFSGLLLLQLLVILLGLLPSGVLAMETYVESPLGFSVRRLAFDLYALLSAFGLTWFEARDLLLGLASRNEVLLVGLWVAMVLLLLTPLIPKRWRAPVLPWWLWLGMGLGPLRGMEIPWFSLANLYVAVPALALGAAAGIGLLARRSRPLASVLAVAIGIWLGWGLITSQTRLVRMGRFNHELHSLLEPSSRADPGPLRVVVNNPDPFGVSALGESWTIFLVFRPAQSAMSLGGWTAESETLVRERSVQVVAHDIDGACRFSANVVDRERLRITAEGAADEAGRCLARLRWADFEPESRPTAGSVVARRRPGYGDVPLTGAEIYAFDTAEGRLRPAASEPSSVR